MEILNRRDLRMGEINGYVQTFGDYIRGSLRLLFFSHHKYLKEDLIEDQQGCVRHTRIVSHLCEQISN